MSGLQKAIIAIAIIATLYFGFHLTDRLVDKFDRLSPDREVGSSEIVLLRIYVILAGIGVGMMIAAYIRNAKPRA